MFALYRGPYKKYFELKKGNSPEFHNLTCKKQSEQKKKNNYSHQIFFELKKNQNSKFFIETI